MAEPEACAVCEKHRRASPLVGEPVAPRGDAEEVARCCARLREALG